MIRKVNTFTLMAFILSLSLFFSGPSFAKRKRGAKRGSAKVQMSSKWHRLNALIDKEERAIKAVTKSGPRLRWRLLELNAEKIKLIREKENKIFLETNPKYRKKKGKPYFFRESHNKYLRARKEGLAIVKKWPHFRHNSDIYYTLALNSRDYGGDRETEKFLLKALKTATRNSRLIHFIKTSLAEHYYNTKEYGKSIRYYTDVLRKTSDEWYTKHLYNVSWCYLKTQQYGKAINFALKSFYISKKDVTKRYISVEEQVLDSIGFFYVLGDRINEGVRFYTSNVKNPAPYLIKMAKKASSDKGAKMGEPIYLAALKNAMSKKSYKTRRGRKYLKEEVHIRLELLEFYRNFKKFNRFWKQSLALDKINRRRSLKRIDDGYQRDIVEKIRSFVGYLQVRFTRNSKTDIRNFSKSKRDRIIDFFNILARINPPETDSYRFFQGETFFAVNDFNHSFEFYQKALEANKELLSPSLKSKKKYPKKRSKRRGKKKRRVKQVKITMTPEEKKKHQVLTKKIYDALLASLEHGRFKKEENYKNTVYTYTNHLQSYPRSERTRVIYSKLFNLYLKNIKIDECTDTLEKYMKIFPKDKKIQQGMLTQVMDLHIKNKNTDALALWINKLEKGFLSFKGDYIEKSILILGGLLFNEYQKMDAAGEKKEAAKGYIGLFKSPKYPKSIKAKSAYRASLLYLDIYNTKKSYEWMKIALRLFNVKERFERKKEILAVVQNLMLAQDFSSSSEIAETYLDIYCHSRFKEKADLYQASVQYRLIEGEDAKAYQNYEKGRKCHVKKKIRDAVLLGMGDFFFRHRLYKDFMEFHQRYRSQTYLRNFFHNSFLAMYWDYYLKDDKKNMDYIVGLFKKNFTRTNKSRAQKEMEMVLNFNRLSVNLERQNVTQLPPPSKYKEALFNKQLEQNIQTLKNMANQLAPYIKSGQPHVITKSYKILETKYKDLADTLENYTPQNLPKDYVQGLKNAMAGLSRGLKEESKRQTETALSIITKETILGPNNKLFRNIPSVIEEVNHYHPASLYAIPCDRQSGGSL